MNWKEALEVAYIFTGLPAAYCVWETEKDYLFFMVPEDTPTDTPIEIGVTLTAVAKRTGQAYLYNIFAHQEEFANATIIHSA